MGGPQAEGYEVSRWVVESVAIPSDPSLPVGRFSVNVATEARAKELVEDGRKHGVKRTYREIPDDGDNSRSDHAGNG